MTIAFKQMSTFAFLVDAVRRSTHKHDGRRPMWLQLGPAAFAMLRASSEMRFLCWSPDPAAPLMLEGVRILQIRHGAPPRITHADGTEEEL